MSDDLARIIETLKIGGTIDAEDAIIYAQHFCAEARTKAIEDAAKVAEQTGSDIDGMAVEKTCTSKQVAEFCRTIAADIRALKDGGGT